MAHISPNHAKKIVSGVLMDSEEDIPHGVHQVTEKSLWGQMFWYFCASGVLVGNHKRLFCCKSINCITSYHKKRKLPQTTKNYHKQPQTTTNYHKLPQATTNFHKLPQTNAIYQIVHPWDCLNCSQDLNGPDGRTNMWHLWHLRVKYWYPALHESISAFLKSQRQKRPTSRSAKFQQRKTDAAGFDVMSLENALIDSCNGQ